MKIIQKKISEYQLEAFSDYLLVDKKIEVERSRRNAESEKKIRIAFLSSFTSKGIKEILNVKCCSVGILPEFYLGGYKQYAQEILETGSALYKFDPELTIVFVDIMDLLGETFFSSYRLSDDQRRGLVEEKYNALVSLITTLTRWNSGKIIFHNFEVPIYSPLGILENKQDFGIVEAIHTLNHKLVKKFRNDTLVFIFDYNSFCSRIGKRNVMDFKMYYLGDIKLSLRYLPELCNEYLSYIKPLMSMTRKCIVLDLDNTLWGGVIGEDGLEGIKLGPTIEGRSFWEFQKYLLSLYNRGVILAINSKNNPDDVLGVFKQHPYMVLKEEHFTSMQINWNDKVSNMKAIAEEISISLDSLVFIDDDKLNREMVRNVLPEILIVDLPEDPSLYLKKLIEIDDFNILQITDEDKKKGRMYVQQRQRARFQESVIDVSQYLKGLEMLVTIELANSFNIPRISQLTQKTNQFNMTTKRYLEEDIKRFALEDGFIVVCIKVEDKFGDNGIVGVVIVEKGVSKWKIDTFLLSCRIIGRRIEETILAYILELAREEKVETLIGEFIPTKKNVPAMDFYKNNGFGLVYKKKGVCTWEYKVVKVYSFPDFIKVERGDIDLAIK